MQRTGPMVKEIKEDVVWWKGGKGLFPVSKVSFGRCSAGKASLSKIGSKLTKTT